MEALDDNFASHFQPSMTEVSDSSSDSDSDSGSAAPLSSLRGASAAPVQSSSDSDSDSDGQAAPQFHGHAPPQSGASDEIPAHLLEGLERRSGRQRKQVSTFNVAPDSPTPRGRAAKRGRGKGRGRAQESDGSEDGEWSDEDSDDYQPRKRKAARRGGKGGRRNAPPVSRGTGRGNAVNYNEDSDMDEDERAYEREQALKKRNAQDALGDPDVELAGGDIIEKVLDHRYWSQEGPTSHPFGVANVDKDGRTAEAVLGPEVRPNADGQEGHLKFLVKWKGWAHIHNEWYSEAKLSEFNGYRKVQTYVKKMQDHDAMYRLWPEEEQEVWRAERMQAVEALESHVNVERVCAVREAQRAGNTGQEYFTKWEGLNYDEASWEAEDDLAPRYQNPFARAAGALDQPKVQDKIDEFHRRKEIAIPPSQRKSAFHKPEARVDAKDRDYTEQPEWLQNGDLRDYQLSGVNWLYRAWCQNLNTILADEMGLGKTLQTVTFLSMLFYRKQIAGPFLLVVPLITVDAWRREFAKWVPDMNVIVYHGNKDSRQLVEEYEFYQIEGGLRKRDIAFHVLITTYEMVLADQAVLKRFDWQFLAIDEAHRLKNEESKLFDAMYRFKTANTLLITGTPIQNDLNELFTLLHFLHRDRPPFDDREAFLEEFDSVAGEETAKARSRVEALHKALKPHLLRRDKKDTEKSLPPKSYRVVRISNTPMQNKFYRDVLSKNFVELNRGVKGRKLGLLNIVIELKKVCNHPFLFESSGYQGRVVDMSPRSMDRARHNAEERKAALIAASGKMIFLDKMLTRLKAEGHRVLIFSQMVRVLNILEDYLKLKSFPFQRIDGSTPKQKRFQAMDHYNEPGSTDFVFLLSTRAGGLGINLATADTVIIFDSDWNPQNDLQAESRAHRIGQKLPVIVFRLVAKGTVEEDILEKAKQKLVRSELVINGMDTGASASSKGGSSSKFDAKELDSILKFGAAELFKEQEKDEDDESAVDKIASELDYGNLLERPSYETAKDEEAPGAGGSELMKTFNTIDIDDNFWENTIAKNEQEKAKAAEAAKDTVEGERQREKVNYDEGNAYADGDDSDDDIFEDGLKNRRKRTSKEDMAPDAACLNAAEKKRWLNAFRKFGMNERLDAILADADLSEKVADDAARAEVLNLGEMLLRECKSRVSKMEAESMAQAQAAASPESGGASPESKVKTTGQVDYCGLKVDAKTLTMRKNDMRFLSKHISRVAKERAASKGLAEDKGDPLASDFDVDLFRVKNRSTGVAPPVRTHHRAVHCATPPCSSSWRV